MKKFDPSAPAMVHDRLNDRAFEWSPIPVPGIDSGNQFRLLVA